MAMHVSVGDTVRLRRPYAGIHSAGVVIDIYGMISAAGIKRTKWVLEFPHNRTKSRTVRVAYELEDFDW